MQRGYITIATERGIPDGMPKKPKTQILQHSQIQLFVICYIEVPHFLPEKEKVE